MLPDFLIIGAQRSGSTSLYRYLTGNPCVAPAARKEVHFFDFHVRRGLGWYRGHFPSALQRTAARMSGRRFMTGEASPYYLMHPHAPRRAAETVPAAKILAVLRDPVARAYSHYQQTRRSGLETLPFEDAIAAEPQRLAGEIARMRRDEHYYSLAHHRFSYLARGVYVDQIRAWSEYFPASQTMVLRSEDLFRDPDRAMRDVCEFLGISWNPLDRYTRFNARAYSPVDDRTRARLIEYFEPHNRRLEEYLGRSFAW